MKELLKLVVRRIRPDSNNIFQRATPFFIQEDGPSEQPAVEQFSNALINCGFLLIIHSHLFQSGLGFSGLEEDP